MTDCLCVFDHEAGWYAAVCDFHAPAVQYPGMEGATLHGHRVAPTAVTVSIDLGPQPQLDAVEARRAVKRVTLAEAEAAETANLNRRARRDRGERSVYAAHLGGLSLRRLRGRR